MGTTEIPCNYVADFKIGDNLSFNADVLCHLVLVNENGLLNKVIIIQVASIIEASLSEIISRARDFKREGVPNISTQEQAEIRSKKIDKFYHVINILKKYKVLDEARVNIYDDLQKIRKYRNKIHIQENIAIDGASKDEGTIFTDELTRWSLALNVEVLSYLSGPLARPNHIHDYVRPLVVPA